MSCNGCHTVSAGTNPDVVRISNEDKASIGVDKIREMIKDVYVRPIISDKKVIVIENAHLLTKGAQNALLKVIEEPPEYAVFIIVCETAAERELPPLPEDLFEPGRSYRYGQIHSCGPICIKVWSIFWHDMLWGKCQDLKIFFQKLFTRVVATQSIQ